MTVSKAEQGRRINYHYMADAMRQLEWDLHQPILRQMRIPDAWHEIAREKPEPRKTRVTLRLDEDLVRFFRSMGPRWQTRVNQLMSVWMHARLAGLIEGAEAMDYLARAEAEDLTGPRPEPGDSQRDYDALMAEIDGEDVPRPRQRTPVAKLSPEGRKALMEQMKARNGMV